MIRCNNRLCVWTLLALVAVFIQAIFHASEVRAQDGFVLAGLADSATNLDVTEDASGAPNAMVTIGFDLLGNPITPMPGGANGIEDVDNLVNNITAGDPADNQAKWLDFQGDDMMMPVHMKLAQAETVTWYTMTSANDAPDRDPYRWRLLGTNVANPTMVSDFVVLDSRDGIDFTARDQTRLFTFSNTTAYTTYRFEFETEEVAIPGTPTAGNYDSIQLGEVELFEEFMFTAPVPVLTINRGTGAMTLSNVGGIAMNMYGYSLTSAAGTLNSTAWASIANTYDGNDGGEADSDNWLLLTEPNGRNDLSEVEDPNGTGGATFDPAEALSLGNAWIKYPTEDVVGEILLTDGSALNVTVTYEGGSPFIFGDLDFNGTVGITDWNRFKNDQGFNFSTAFSPPESYAHGDLDSDFDHDGDDFGIFKAAFDAANGAGAFEAMLAAVPEPNSAILIAAIATLLAAVRIPRRVLSLLLAVVCVTFVVVGSGRAQAGEVLTGLRATLQPPLVDLTDQDNVAPIDVTITAGDAANSPMTEMPPMLVDNAVGTKWLAFQPNGTFYQVQFNGGAQHAVNTYTLTSANDAAERDPYRWTLSGSNDGTNFTVVDEQSGQDFTARGQTQQFVVGNTTPYNFYRFDFLTGFGAGAFGSGVPNSIQIAELELFDDPDPDVLTLEVNPAAGSVRLANNSDDAVSLDYYRIQSASGSLNRNVWWGAGAQGTRNGGQSLHDQNIIGFPFGNGTGNGWEEGPDSTNNEIVEWWLTGASTLGSEQGITMNNVFQTGGAQDLVFEYRSNGQNVRGFVEYLGGPNLVGDYNGDGSVDAADYTVWRDTLGSTTNLAADGNGDLVVNQADFTEWKNNFDASGSGSAVQAAAVPEPTSLLLALAAPVMLFFGRPRSMGRSIRSGPAAIVVAIAGFLVTGTDAASTVDRNYRFGDDSQENANAGQTVGQASVVANHTLDSASQGSFFDIMQNGGPTYVTTQSTGRPGAIGTEKGIQFTGSSSQYLTGAGFGSPNEGGALANPPITTYPESRIMQIWARPTLDTSARQDIVSDTFQFGLFLAPTAAMGDDVEVWGHAYGSDVAPADLGDDFLTTVPVVYNQWTHLMQRTFENDGVALYINGVAVSRFNADYEVSTNAVTPTPNRNLYVGAASGGAANFFTGQLDNLKIAVAGNTTATGGQDWGAVDLGAENEYIAFALAQDGFIQGDVNGDGVVNGNGTGPAATDDVRFFIDHWLDEYRVNNFLIGDLVSRTTQADLNFDGRTSLADWFILRNAHASGASLDLAALLADGNVPEPSTLVILALGGVCLGGLGRRRRRIRP